MIVLAAEERLKAMTYARTGTSTVSRLVLHIGCSCHSSGTHQQYRTLVSSPYQVQVDGVCVLELIYGNCAVFAQLTVAHLVRELRKLGDC